MDIKTCESLIIYYSTSTLNLLLTSDVNMAYNKKAYIPIQCHSSLTDDSDSSWLSQLDTFNLWNSVNLKFWGSLRYATASYRIDNLQSIISEICRHQLNWTCWLNLKLLCHIFSYVNFYDTWDTKFIGNVSHLSHCWICNNGDIVITWVTFKWDEVNGNW